jgi:hypothetical protein
VDQAHAVAGDRQARPDLDRGCNAPREEGRIDALLLVEAPGAQADQ